MQILDLHRVGSCLLRSTLFLDACIFAALMIARSMHRSFSILTVLVRCSFN